MDSIQSLRLWMLVVHRRYRRLVENVRRLVLDTTDEADDMVTDSDSAPDNNLSVAAGSRRSRKPPGFYRE